VRIKTYIRIKTYKSNMIKGGINVGSSILKVKILQSEGIYEKNLGGVTYERSKE
jgi:hypothetical protein